MCYQLCLLLHFVFITFIANEYFLTDIFRLLCWGFFSIYPFFLPNFFFCHPSWDLFFLPLKKRFVTLKLAASALFSA